MTDIVERLREAAAVSLNEYGERDRYLEAADEIDRLRGQRDAALVEAVGLRAAVTAMRAALMAREET